jgi:hypothetical protein
MEFLFVTYAGTRHDVEMSLSENPLAPVQFQFHSSLLVSIMWLFSNVELVVTYFSLGDLDKTFCSLRRKRMCAMAFRSVSCCEVNSDQASYTKEQDIGVAWH